MIDDLGTVLIGIGVIALYVWVIGTLIWMWFVVPRMHKRQGEILQRLNAIEKRLGDFRNVDPNK